MSDAPFAHRPRGWRPDVSTEPTGIAKVAPDRCLHQPSQDKSGGDFMADVIPAGTIVQMPVSEIERLTAAGFLVPVD